MDTDIHSKFEVAESRVYDAYPLTPPLPALPEKALQLHARMVDARRPLEAEKKSAVWVVHGMGQQVPFATLEQVAEGIICTLGDANVVNLLYREVKVDKTVLQQNQSLRALYGEARVLARTVESPNQTDASR